MDQAWTLSVEDALQHFGVNPKVGLSEKEVSSGLEKYGKNGTLKLYSRQSSRMSLQRRSGDLFWSSFKISSCSFFLVLRSFR